MDEQTEKIWHEIAEEYKDEVFVPDFKPKKQMILLPIGLIGAGKTPVCKALSEKLGLVRISNDEIRYKLKQRGLSFDATRQIARKVGCHFIDLGFSMALDANSGGEGGNELSLFLNENYPKVIKIWVYINSPEDYIIEKLKNYNHTWLFRDAEHAIKNHLTSKQNFKMPDVDITYEFDLSKSDFKDQIEESVRVIRRKLEDN